MNWSLLDLLSRSIGINEYSEILALLPQFTYSTHPSVCHMIKTLREREEEVNVCLRGHDI
jgi:hypothetical protein